MIVWSSILSIKFELLQTGQMVYEEKMGTHSWRWRATTNSGDGFYSPDFCTGEADRTPCFWRDVGQHICRNEVSASWMSNCNELFENFLDGIESDEDVHKDLQLRLFLKKL